MDNRLKDYGIEVIKRYDELRELQRLGEIVELNILPNFPVLDAFEKNSVSYPVLNYTPCFSFVDKRGNKYIEDDIPKTESRRILRTMFEYTYMNLSVKDIL